MSNKSNHVVWVTHNLKGGGEAKLAQRTLIVGPNGSGKSAIINAVELALTGKASDIAGREVVAQAAALATLANGSGAWAEAHLDDGSRARWEVKRSGTKLSRPKRDGRMGIVPLREVVESLTGSADKARKFLLQHVCEGLDNRAIVGRLDQDQLSRYQRLTDGPLSPIDNLLAVEDLAGKRGREANKLAQGAEVTEEATAAGLQRQPTEGEVYEAHQRLQEAETAHGGATTLVATIQAAQRGTGGAPVDVRMQIQRLDAALVECRAEQTQTQAALDALPLDTKAINRKLLMDIIKLMQTEWTEGPCVACGTDFDRHAWKAHAGRVEAAVRQGQEKMAGRELERRNLRARVVELQSLVQRAQAKLSGLRVSLGEHRPLLAVPDMSLEEAQSAQSATLVERDAAQSAYMELRESRACWERVSRARDSRRQAEREAEGWVHLQKICKSLIEELVEDAVSTFANRVQRHLHKDDTFGLRLEKSSVRYGLVHDGNLHTALSGAEWARVAAALAAACTPDDAEVAVLVPEDRAWDPKTLKRVLQGLSDYRGQVLLATTVKPFRGVPAGWTMIEVGE